MHLDFSAELFVSDAVDERAEKTRKNVGEEEGAEEDVCSLVGPIGDEDEVDEGWDEGQQAEEQLDPVEQDGVSGVSHRGSTHTWNPPSCEEHVQIGEDHREEDEGEQEHLRRKRGVLINLLRTAPPGTGRINASFAGNNV